FMWGNASDGFEVHQMVIDCNATNLPKYTIGEPVTVRVPLATNSHVEAVTLRWSGAPGGRASEFNLAAQQLGTNTYFTNLTSLTGQVAVLTVGADADELVLQFTRRAAGVDFYGLSEIEVSNAPVSLFSGSALPGGNESRLDANRTIYSILD